MFPKSTPQQSNRHSRNQIKSQREHPINDEIGFAMLRVSDADGKQLGVMDRRQAMDMAREANCDLVLLVANANPPVCKIVDYGKFMYAEQKKKKELDKVKRSNKIETKEFQFRPQIDVHDLDIKVRKMQQVINDGDKCKVIITFKGRENHDPNKGRVLIDLITSKISAAAMESKPELTANKLVFLIAPTVKKVTNHVLT